ncbi:site-specific DNA-methyltransferase, partial [Corynebacterium accolens]
MSEEQDMINEVPGSSPEFRTELAEQLAELAPEAIADGKIDVEKLKELLECDASDTSERFGLFWPGKKRAMRAAQTPTTATLRPDKENSKDWDTTKNVFIEGDNLEVLKILQKHYHGKIKMIYIDPPYNTGKDFVYPDNYKEGLETYLEWSKQVNEDGKKLSSNSESEGRYHSNWLNMMYPRLKLARNLLASDGFIAVSIGDDEVGTLRLLMDTVFGEDNRIAQVSVNRTSEIATELTVQKIEYLLVYARHIIDTELGAADKIVESRGTVGNIDQTMPLIEFPSGLRCVNIPDGTYDSSRQIEGSNENIELIDQAVVSNGSLAKPVRLKARWRASNDMRKFFANDCQPTKAKING